MPARPKRNLPVIPRRLTDEGREGLKKYDELQRCIRSSWYLATEYLGYGWDEKAGLGLVDRVHEPICRWYDRNRNEPRLGIWMARGRHKTTLIVTWIIQDILRDPSLSHRYWHAVNELAAEFLLEVVSHMRDNERLRWLDPVGYDPVTESRYDIFPSKRATRWYKTAKGDASLRVKSHRRFGAGTRSATLRAQGQTSEVTGAHINGVGWMDDIIAESTVLNSELHKVAEWYRRSVVPVVDSKKFRVVGTPWPGQTIYKQWMQSGRWKTLIVPGAISDTDEEFKARLESKDKKLHFVPDYKFTNPMHGTKERKAEAVEKLRDEQEDMQGAFGPQIMMDDEPESEKFWSQSACEHFCTSAERGGVPGAFDGQGITVVLADPAPLHSGSYKGLGEKQRMDGTKDWWSIAVVRIRVRVALRERVLLDGRHSLEWTEDQGCDVACSLMKKWRTNLFVSEDPDAWHDRMILASRRNGVALRRANDGGPLKFELYNKAERKIGSFSDLSHAAKDGLFYILDTCPDEFLYGDQEHTGFLTQMRKVRKITAASGKSKTNLRWDDDADVVARSGDKLFDEMAPMIVSPDDLDIEPAEPYMAISRYCGV